MTPATMFTTYLALGLGAQHCIAAGLDTPASLWGDFGFLLRQLRLDWNGR